jgi:hypothetical protein
MSTSGNQPPGRAAAAPSFWRALRMVAWGFLGVRKSSEYQQDLAQVKPLHIIVTAALGALALVLALVLLVNWVVASSA